MLQKRRLSILIGLLLSLTIPSYGQVLVIGSDTVSCYSAKEVREIAKIVTLYNSCDTLLSLEKIENTLLRKQITEYKDIRINDSLIMKHKDGQIRHRDQIIEHQNDEITQLNKKLKKERVLKNSGLIILTLSTIYFAIF